MAAEPTNDIIEPEDSESVTPASTPDDASLAAASPAGNADVDAEVPVPVAMEPAEIDERARVIEELNRSGELP